MNIAGVTAVALALGLAPLEANAETLPVPLGPASDGKAQCYEPNVAAKTCKALARYERGAGGQILNPAVLMLAAKPLITMATVTAVVVKDGQVCGVVRSEDMDHAQFTVEGSPATPEQASRLRQGVATAEAGIFGKQICTRYVPEGDVLLAKATIDGVAQAEQQRVIWVSSTDGFSVGP